MSSEDGQVCRYQRSIKIFGSRSLWRNYRRQYKVLLTIFKIKALRWNRFVVRRIIFSMGHYPKRPCYEASLRPLIYLSFFKVNLGSSNSRGLAYSFSAA
jgi:hypothetical protein